MELGGANGARLTLLMLTARTRNNAEAIQVPRQRPARVSTVREYQLDQLPGWAMGTRG